MYRAPTGEYEERARCIVPLRVKYEERARCIVPLRVMVEGRRIHSEVKWQKVGGSTVRLNGRREEVSSPVYPVARG